MKNFNGMAGERNLWPSVEIVTEYMWVEILADLDAGAVRNIHCFADLHDYTDANMYGLNAFPPAPPEEDEDAWAAWFDKVSNITGQAQAIVSGRLEKRNHAIG